MSGNESVIMEVQSWLQISFTKLSRVPVVMCWKTGDGVFVFLLYGFVTEQNMSRWSLMPTFSVSAKTLFDLTFVINRSILDAV